MNESTYMICQIIVVVVGLVFLAWILQRIFNPKKNTMMRKYVDMENEPKEEKKELSEEEKKFYEEIWNAKKDSKGKRSDEGP